MAENPTISTLCRIPNYVALVCTKTQFLNNYRYKTHDEQRAERRNYYSEREIPVSAPQAPPRNKKKRQSFREFREENKTQELFQSEHQTEDGSALLPINKIIAFDCPADGAASEDDIFVGLKGTYDTVWKLGNFRQQNSTMW